MNKYKLIQEQGEGIWKVIESSNDYDALYVKMMGDHELRKQGMKMEIVERQTMFYPPVEKK